MNANKTQLAQQFVGTIRADIQRYQQLAQLLKAQKPLYLQFDGAALDANLNQLNPLLEELNQSAATRSNCMKMLNLPVNEQGANRLLNALPAPIKPGILKQWAKLQSLIQHCQQLNHDNGQSSASFHELIKQIFQPEQHTYQELNAW